MTKESFVTAVVAKHGEELRTCAENYYEKNGLFVPSVTALKRSVARKPKKTKKPKQGPKKPLSAYMIFVQRMRPVVNDQNPDATFATLSKILGAKWSAMTDKERKKYVDLAEIDKLRYSDEMDDYKATLAARESE